MKILGQGRTRQNITDCESENYRDEPQRKGKSSFATIKSDYERQSKTDLPLKICTSGEYIIPSPPIPYESKSYICNQALIFTVTEKTYVAGGAQNNHCRDNDKLLCWNRWVSSKQALIFPDTPPPTPSFSTVHFVF